MRILKDKQYEYRYKQFKKEFESDLPEGSPAYTTKLYDDFEKSLTEDGIALPLLIPG